MSDKPFVQDATGVYSASRVSDISDFLSAILSSRALLSTKPTEAGPSSVAAEDARRALQVTALRAGHVIGGTHTKDAAARLLAAIGPHLLALVWPPVAGKGICIDLADLDAAPACATGVPEIDAATATIRQLLYACADARLRVAGAPNGHQRTIMGGFHCAVKDQLVAYLSPGNSPSGRLVGADHLFPLERLLRSVAFGGLVGVAVDAQEPDTADQEPEPPSTASLGMLRGRMLRRRAGDVMTFLATLHRSLPARTGTVAVSEDAVHALVDQLMVVIGAAPADASELESARTAVAVEIARMLAGEKPADTVSEERTPYTRVEHAAGRGELEPVAECPQTTDDEPAHTLFYVRHAEKGAAYFGSADGRNRACQVMGCRERECRIVWSDNTVSWVCAAP